ncbi:MAG TPA: DUF4232 domain-containing protein, partial [Candidatus Dormibacteraeota bacterium]|nr:DUF4232 domain-containing protein [Candidatus Dormibacteraeota bacterium]
AIPVTYQAQLYDDAQTFSLDYVGPNGQKISFAIVVANPGPGTPNVRQSSPTFRGVRAEYQVDDATVPTSHRWLMWNEPGTSVGGQPGLSYFLATEGLTESEFWSIANSIGPIPAPKAVRSCAMNDLYAVSNGASGATGHIVYGIALANHSTTPCSVQGFPRLSLITKAGTVVSLTESNDPGGIVGNGRQDIPSGILQPNQPAPVPHQGAANAYFLFEWYYCGATAPDIAAVDVAIPAGSKSVRVPLLNEGNAWGPSRCDDVSQGRRLLVGPIQPPAADQVVTQAPQWQVTMQVAQQFVVGKVVDFTVTLTNVSGAPIVFDTCPTYDEGFATDMLVAYQLNCGSVGAVQPGASVTFAMQFTVPLKTPVGPEKFRWSLRGSDALASAGALVTVTDH